MMNYQPTQPQRLSFLTLLFLFVTTCIVGQLSPIGIFDHHEDIGNPKLKGAAIYNKNEQTYTVTAAGANMW